MALSPIAEYLLSLGTDETPLVHGFIDQFFIPIFPPNTTIGGQIYPMNSAYADIVVRFEWDTRVLPGIFTSYIQYYGRTALNGVISADMIEHGIDCFIVITRKSPGFNIVTNTTPINQLYLINLHTISIRDITTWDKIVLALKRLQTNTMAGELLAKMGGLA